MTRCICSSPGGSIQCVACYPHLDQKVNVANPAYAACAEHGDALIAEPGGPDMPTLYGRTYCPTCQVRFNEVMDSLPRASAFPPEVSS